MVIRCVMIPDVDALIISVNNVKAERTVENASIASIASIGYSTRPENPTVERTLAATSLGKQ